MSNIVIVGSGPAGVSAALYAVRAGVQTTVLTKGSGALARAEKIENYYGFAQPVSGPELERRSIENARRLGVQFVQTEAVGLTWTDRLTVEHSGSVEAGGSGPTADKRLAHITLRQRAEEAHAYIESCFGRSLYPPERLRKAEQEL